MIEVEFRSRFDKNKHNKLKEFLEEKGDDLGEDNQHAFFFIMPDKLLKVAYLESKNKSKIALKGSKVGESHYFEEIELEIRNEDFLNAKELFSKITNSLISESYQKRHNYKYKGVDIALKYSEHWGYHGELEILVDKREEAEDAEGKIREIAKELGLHLMTNKELKLFTKKVEKQIK